MPSQSVFSRRLRQAREAAGLSQKGLGIEVGLDPGVASARINRYEQAVHLPDIETAQRLADRLGVPLPYLFASDDALAQAILDYAASVKTRICRDD
jgi:transcriptional regulator with XRE-family HTH domain